MVKVYGRETKLVQGPRDEEHRLLAEQKLAEFRKLHDNAGGAIQDVLMALYHTGASQKEVLDLVFPWSAPL